MANKMKNTSFLARKWKKNYISCNSINKKRIYQVNRICLLFTYCSIQTETIYSLHLDMQI